MGRPEAAGEMGKIERKFSSGVLIGNWVEDKLKFTKECPTTEGISTYQHDYHPQRNHKPDVLVRGDALRRAEGLPKKLLLSHHDAPQSHHLVSLYGEMYGRTASSALRSWHPDRPAWLPGKSDHPLQSPPTSFGLAESLRARWGQQWSGERAVTVYRAAYPWHAPAALVPTRCIRSPSAPAGRPAIATANASARGLKRHPSSCTDNGTPSHLPALSQGQALYCGHTPCWSTSSWPDPMG